MFWMSYGNSKLATVLSFLGSLIVVSGVYYGTSTGDFVPMLIIAVVGVGVMLCGKLVSDNKTKKQAQEAAQAQLSGQAPSPMPAQEIPAAPQAETVCPQCGASLPAEASFCPHCGNRMGTDA